MPTDASIDEANGRTYTRDLGPRVAALEVGLRNVSTELDHVKVSIDRLASNLNAGFAEIRRDSAASGRTNWGWVIASVAVVVSLIGAIGTAWVRPLQTYDEEFSRRISAIENKIEETDETATRTDERLRVYRELGISIPTSVVPIKSP